MKPCAPVVVPSTRLNLTKNLSPNPRLMHDLPSRDDLYNLYSCGRRGRRPPHARARVLPKPFGSWLRRGLRLSIARCLKPGSALLACFGNFLLVSILGVVLVGCGSTPNQSDG